MLIHQGFIFAFLTAVLVIFGDTLIKVAADRATLSSPPMFAGMTLYAISAVCWYFTMRHAGLAEGAVAYSMLTLIALCLIGATIFDEPIGKREGLGLTFAVAAMFLMSHQA